MMMLAPPKTDGFGDVLVIRSSEDEAAAFHTSR